MQNVLYKHLLQCFLKQKKKHSVFLGKAVALLG